MKKIIVYFYVLATLFYATYSCVSSQVFDVDETPTPPSEKENIYFVRLLLESMKGDETFYLDWSSFRNVGLFVDGDDNSVLLNNRKVEIEKESGHGVEVYIDTLLTSCEKGTVYAYASYGVVENNTIRRTLNATQNQTVSRAGPIDDEVTSNMMLVGTPATVVFDQGTTELKLENVFSLISVTISRSAAFSLFNRRIQSVKLYVADADNIRESIDSHTLAGEYSIDIKNNSAPQFSNSFFSISSTTSSIALLDNNPVFYFLVNPFTLAPNEKLVVCFETNNKDVTYCDFNLSAAKNNVYNISAVATNENTYIDVVNEKFVSTYSNCYIVSEKGKYQIPADKTINGKVFEGIGNRADWTCEWLWASKEGGNNDFTISELINPSFLKYNNGNISFQIGDANPFSVMQKGNVILALKDAAGEIVWTWHIWITDQPEDIIYGDIGGKDIVFLDRNIGAMKADMTSAAIDNFGFVYQWGRKDPFFGGHGISNETNTNTSILSIAKANTIVNTGHEWSRRQEIADANIAKQNPMSFIFNQISTTNYNKPVDWLSGGAENRWSDTEKTDNDPCPNGYKAPSRDTLQILHDAESHWAFNPDEEIFYFKPQGTQYWEYYSLNVGKGKKTAWPMAGMRQGRNINNGGAQLINSGTAAARGNCFYWTSTPVKIGDSYLPGASYRIYTSASPPMLYSKDEFGDNADAYPVRCIKMNP